MVFGTLKAVVKLVWFLDKRSSELSALKSLIPLDLDICLYFIYLSVFFLPLNTIGTRWKHTTQPNLLLTFKS